jgi:hypothetical protein
VPKIWAPILATTAKNAKTTHRCKDPGRRSLQVWVKIGKCVVCVQSMQGSGNRAHAVDVEGEGEGEGEGAPQTKTRKEWHGWWPCPVLPLRHGSNPTFHRWPR